MLVIVLWGTQLRNWFICSESTPVWFVLAECVLLTSELYTWICCFVERVLCFSWFCLKMELRLEFLEANLRSVHLGIMNWSGHGSVLLILIHFSLVFRSFDPHWCHLFSLFEKEFTFFFFLNFKESSYKLIACQKWK